MASTQTEAAQKEAHQYWGYLFKPDRTGTDMLKNLLRGIHKIIGTTFEPSDSPDITPSQIAHFYRALDGNYDQLFLSTPPSTIAFIYKNLGCLHSLQPLPNIGDRFAEPTIPALKVEGWIMWQTVQLLLCPDEQADFLSLAVQKWDVKNPDTGEAYPKILPRSCFPPHADNGMVEWYENMGNRLRREAEEQERARITGHEERPDTPVGFKHHRKISKYSNDGLPSDDDASESQNFAIAYFRNPLFRTVDGRPGVARAGSRRRPPISPRDSFVHRGKGIASVVGNVVKNVGSPHLWDGHAAREKERENRRRKSLPDHHNYQDLSDDDHHKDHHSRRGSAQDSPPSDHYTHHHSHHARDNSTTRPSPTHHESAARPRRSHDPSIPRDYFPPYNDAAEARRTQSATYVKPRSASPTKSGFKPSASPLFATHVASAGYRASSHGRPPSQRSPERTDSSARHSAEGSGSEVGSSRGGGRGGGRSKTARFQEVPGGGISARKYEYPVEAGRR